MKVNETETRGYVLRENRYRRIIKKNEEEDSKCVKARERFRYIPDYSSYGNNNTNNNAVTTPKNFNQEMH